MMADVKNMDVHDVIAIAQSGCSYGWAAHDFKCFAEHGKYSPLVADAPVEVQPDELLGPSIFPWPRGEAVQICHK